MKRRFTNSALAAFAALLFCAQSLVAVTPVEFVHDVLPILKRHCAKCHSNGRYEGGLSLDTRESLLESGAVELGKADESAIIERLLVDDVEIRMPLEAAPLSPEEVDILRRWIDSGLEWQDGLSLRGESYKPPLEPRRPELPQAPPGVMHPIDRLVRAYWHKHGIAPPPRLNDAAFYRRASLDLVGLLPTAAEVTAFKGDPTLDKRQRLVRRLLDDRIGYSDHWLTFWNDLLRNDYVGTGYIDGGRKQITGWLYRALSENMRYDDFVRELVNPSDDSAGFANGIVWRGQVNASQRPELQYAQNVGQVFLGVNLKCASCHDSFVDEWKLADAYGLAAIFSSEPLEIHRCDIPTGKTAEPYFLFKSLGRVDPTAPRAERLRVLARLMTSDDNGRLTRTIVNRLWDRLMGRGLVFPVDSLGSQPWNEDLLDYIAADLQDRGYNLKLTLELLATSEVYGMESVPWNATAPANEYEFRGVAPKRMTAEQFVDAVWQIAKIAPTSTADDEVFAIRQRDGSRAIGATTFTRASLVESTPLMRSLGRPSREQVVSSRPAEMTTLEAVELSNGKPFAVLVQQAAEQLQRDHPEKSIQRLQQYLFQAALAREPAAEEVASVSDSHGETASLTEIEDLLWRVLVLPEFQIIY